MAVVPLNQISSLKNLSNLENLNQVSSLNELANQNRLSTNNTSEVEIPFQSIFQDAVDNVKATEAAKNDEIYKLATGQSDDLHNITIASAKASLSVDLLVQLRNKALDAYKEIMNMGV